MVVLKSGLRSPTRLDAPVDTADVDGEMWQRLNDPALAELITEAVSESRDNGTGIPLEAKDVNRSSRPSQPARGWDLVFR
jgi:hypothetical protein